MYFEPSKSACSILIDFKMFLKDPNFSQPHSSIAILVIFTFIKVNTYYCKVNFTNYLKNNIKLFAGCFTVAVDVTECIYRWREQDIKIWYRTAWSKFKISANVTYFHSVCSMLMLYTANSILNKVVLVFSLTSNV